MKKTIFAYLFALAGCASYGQAKDTWIAFENTEDDLIYTGFKDSNGTVKIPPVFTGFTVAKKFDNIIGAMEFVDNRYTDPFYITKTGAIIKDSVYVSNYTFDCESEGCIRFKDPKTGNIGLFNGDAKVVIPAQYNDLTPVHNGLLVGIKGATKETDGEQFRWVGGTKQLIDLNNKVLVEDFKYSGELDFYSLQTTSKELKAKGRHYFKGVNGSYYSFTDFNETFKSWINSDLFKNLNDEYLHTISHNEISHSDKSKEWMSEDKNSFLNRDSKYIIIKLQGLKSGKLAYETGIGFITPDMFPPEKYSDYYDNCNRIKYAQYPVMVITTKENTKNVKPDRFYFAYTGNGYKLIGIAAENILLK